MLKKISTDKAPAAIGPYSQAIVAGDLLFTSGQIPINPAIGDVEAEGIEAQAEQVMKNLGEVLAAAGTDFAHVVKTTCFLAEMADFAAFNSVYEKYFTEKPARSCVAVKQLPKNVLCEVEVIASWQNKMKNIVLIGMPGAGKSTVGVVLAKHAGFSFVDSDLVIQEQTHKLLHEIITEVGDDGFRQVENRINAALQVKHSVIATGGSVVYGREAMHHLKEIGVVVYLKLSYESIAERLGDLKERGVTLRPGQTLQQLYDERVPLYERYADVTVECEHKSIREIVAEISARMIFN